MASKIATQAPNSTPSRKSKGKGKVRGLRIEKASNGHTMRIERERDYNGPYEEPEQRVYGPGQHEAMFADARKALGVGAAKKPQMQADKIMDKMRGEY